MSKKKEYTNKDIKFEEEGVCPICGNSDPDYGGCEPDGEQMYYEISCDKCNFVGREYYDLSYSETVVL